MVIQIPIEERPIAEAVAAKYDMRFADGVPTMLTGEGTKQYPLSGDNVWTIEQSGGGYMDVTKEDELCDKILAQYELHKEKLTAIHFNQPVIEIDHSDLRTIPGCDSLFRRFCPVCTHGMLCLQRDDTTYRLKEIDRCILCAQPFRYLDIDRLRAFGDPPPGWKMPP